MCNDVMLGFDRCEICEVSVNSSHQLQVRIGMVISKLGHKHALFRRSLLNSSEDILFIKKIYLKKVKFRLRYTIGQCRNAIFRPLFTVDVIVSTFFSLYIVHDEAKFNSL
jgi:hypothetical protein